MIFPKLFLGDVKFQRRYGFYLLYAAVTLLYLIVLFQLPSDWKETAGGMLLFTDPTVLGLIFSGAIVQLEIAERTFDSLAIAPIKPSWYVASKALSLAMLSSACAILIGAFAFPLARLPWVIAAVFLGSMVFTMIGLILAFQTRSLNRFFFTVILIMLVAMLPGVARLFLTLPAWMVIHPGIAVMEILLHTSQTAVSFVSLVLWFLILFAWASRVVFLRMKPTGGKRS